MSETELSSIFSGTGGVIRFKESVIIADLDIDAYGSKKLVLILGHIALKADYSVKELIGLFDKGVKIDDLYCTLDDMKIDPSIADGMICRLAEYGLFIGTQGKRQKSELLLKLPIFSEETIIRFKWLQGLFSKRLLLIISLFSSACILLALKTYYLALVNNTVKPISIVEIVIVLILIAVSGFFHELGHAAALMRYGGRPGEIGIGIYIASIVAYSNVNEAWRLKSYERLVVDFGGIYFQSIFAAIITAVFYLTKNNALFYTSVCLGLGVITNCLPVLKLDGYWVACDYFNVDNINRIVWEMLFSKDYRSRLPLKIQLSYFGYLILNAILSLIFAGYFLMLFCGAAAKLHNLILSFGSLKSTKTIAGAIVENSGYILTFVCCMIAVFRLLFGLLRKGGAK